jgi:hypothetical protein
MPFIYCCLRVRFSGNVFTEALPRNGRLFIRLLHSRGCIRCLFRGRCLGTGLYATIRRQNANNGKEWVCDLKDAEVLRVKE